MLYTADLLSKKGTHPKIKEQKSIIDTIRTTEFWEEATILDMEQVRQALRDLVRLIERKNQKIYTTHFEDTIISEESHEAMYNTNNLLQHFRLVSKTSEG